MHSLQRISSSQVSIKLLHVPVVFLLLITLSIRICIPCPAVVGVVAHTFNLRAQEAETGEFLWVQGQTSRQNEFHDGHQRCYTERPCLKVPQREKKIPMPTYLSIMPDWKVLALCHVSCAQKLPKAMTIDSCVFSWAFHMTIHAVSICKTEIKRMIICFCINQESNWRGGGVEFPDWLLLYKELSSAQILTCIIPLSRAAHHKHSLP